MYACFFNIDLDMVGEGAVRFRKSASHFPKVEPIIKFSANNIHRFSGLYQLLACSAAYITLLKARNFF